MKNKIIAFVLAMTSVFSLSTAIPVVAEETKNETVASEETTKKEKKKDNPNISTEYAKAPLFDTTKVHTINIICDDADWDSMIKSAADKEYINCDVEIDGELIKGVSIRPKGNASFRSVASRKDGKTDRFSFKIEFDHQDNSTTYHGLDKLALNSMGQDHSLMKDFLTYTAMRDMGVYAPLCSYTVVQKNGEDFAMYLAVEAIEDSFKLRNYGEDEVDMYKPEIIDTIDRSAQSSQNMSTLLRIMNGSYYADKTENDRVDIFHDYWGGVNGTVGFTSEFNTVADLRWVDNNVDSYNVIWDESVFNSSDKDKERFVASLNTLNNGKSTTEKQSVVDVDQVMRYFVVHNFTGNNDGLTGIQHHNFYVTEHNGVLSYVPWDYNVAYGTFEFRTAIRDIIGSDFCLDTTPVRVSNVMSAEKDYINFPIDTPMFTGDNSELPLMDCWLSTKDGMEKYHKIYDEFISKIENGDYSKLIDDTYAMLSPYVDKDLVFYDSNEVKDGVDNMKMYFDYRAKAIRGQLDGSIPSTKDGQADKPETLINPDGLEFPKLGDTDHAASCPPVSMLNPIVHAFLGNDTDYTAGHFADIILGYYKNPLSVYDRVPELMQVNMMRGVANNIVNSKYGVNQLFFSNPETGKVEITNSKPVEVVIDENEDPIEVVKAVAKTAAKEAADNGGSSEDITNAAAKAAGEKAIELGITDKSAVGQAAGQAAGMNGGDGMAAGKAAAEMIDNK